MNFPFRTFAAVLILLSVCLLLTTCLQEQDLSFNHPATPVFLEFTSTGCPGCGRWGVPKSALLRNIHGDRINPAAIHIRFNDPMESDISVAIGKNRPGRRFTPQFWINNEHVTFINENNRLDSAVTFQQAESVILNEFNSKQLPKLDGSLSKDGSSLTIEYGVKLNQTNSSDTYYLACYLMRDGVEAAQKGYEGQNPPIHNHVLTESISGEPFGKPVDQLSENLIQMFEGRFNVADYKEPTYALLVLWRKNGGHYEAVNSLRLD